MLPPHQAPPAAAGDLVSGHCRAGACTGRGTRHRDSQTLYRMRVPFMRLFDDARNRSEIVATFLAVLELSKTRRIRWKGTAREMELMLTNDNTK